ncbi:GH1 family beta-glucosidase [Aquisalimonas asiatica]|uniref:Beta-glucosidase n=1 Tax=Aquisalimonas asiatica TaxID=406100 RepID=A0A1H8RKD9_9GAMM|nr:GH1 family beta-glucosidase [Aquisalimonas asiatica]SEO66802.1 beta-glucosidase [Aquisalimonas asiatica]
MTFDVPNDSRLRSPDFLFGVATAAYQVEGAAREGGRTPSIWDTFCRQPGRVLNGDTGDVACEHYHRWPEDLDLVQDLGFDAYRLSISWPRVMPRRGEVNPEGLRFYEQIIDGLVERDVKPIVTLYHWDLPQYLDNRGGWVNRETAYAFAEFADVVTAALGNRVEAYATLNEPWCSAFLGYELGVHAPGLKEPRLAYQAAHHLLLAHGLALPAMRHNAPQSRHGLVLNFTPSFPATERYDDQAMALLQDAINGHWFLEPVLEGRYPSLVTRFRPESTPVVYPGDMDIISRPIDFLGVNYYTRSLVTHDQDGEAREVRVENAQRTSMDWEVYPHGLYRLLTDLDRQYHLPPLMVTENGAAVTETVEDDGIHDDLRCDYYNRHLQAVDQAIRDGVNITGYFAWSLLDNFEWAEGYSQRFGLVYVDYDSQERIRKRSATLFREFMAERQSAGAGAAS